MREQFPKEQLTLQMSEKLHNGVLLWFDSRQGEGLVVADAITSGDLMGHSYYVHGSAIPKEHHHDKHKATPIQFTLYENATNVQVDTVEFLGAVK